MNNTNADNTRKFNNILNTFFGHNFYNRYWILLVMYLRKKNLLYVEPNYKGNDEDKLSATYSRFSLTEDVFKKDFSHLFADEDVQDWTVVGKIQSNPSLKKISDTFKDASSTGAPSVNGLDAFAEMVKFDSAALMMIDVANALISLDDTWYNDNFLSLFDQTCRRVFALSDIDMHIQPAEITRFGASLLGKIEGRLYNPFAGLGSYGVIMKDRMEYYGEEINPVIAAIGNLRLMASYVDGEIQVCSAMKDRMYCDAAIATPPFGVKVPYEERFDQGMHDYETLTLLKFAYLDVRSVTIVTQHVCFGGGYCRNLRMNLLSKDCVDMIITLPAGVFNNTGVQTSVFVLSPNHSHPGYIRMVDATKCFTPKPKKGISLNVIEVLAILNDKDSIHSKMVSAKEIEAHDYSFDPMAYMDIQVPNQEGLKLVSLSELGEFYHDRAPRDKKVGKFATFSRLSSANKLKIYGPDDFVEAELPNSAVEISKDCVLLSGARGLRGVCLHTEGELLYGHSGYICFVPNDRELNPLYLILQLQEEYVQRQAGVSSMSNLSIDGFKKLQIAIPIKDDGSVDYERQETIVADYHNQLIKKLGVEVEGLKTQRSSEFHRDMRIRKHQLGQRLNEILPAADVLAYFISSQDGPFRKEDLISDCAKISIEDYAQKLFINIQDLTELISHLTDDESFGTPEEISLVKFTKSFLERKFTESYEAVLLPISDADACEDFKIKMAVSDLMDVFNNIFENAKKHGFKDADRKDYAIRLKIEKTVVGEKDMVRLSVANNGQGLSPNMNAEKLFTWGEGNGTGIGMWHVRNIIEHYGGEIHFHQYDDTDDGFGIEFEILLPLIKSEDHEG